MADMTREEMEALVARVPEGHTPGPWWTSAKYDGREMGCPIIAARTDAGPLPGNPTRGMVAYAPAVLNTEARRCEANAVLIALAPDLAAALRQTLARNAELEAALRWYAEQVAGCRKIGSAGDPFRHALDADGGHRARAALCPTTGAASEGERT